jgi:hypothetical protein
VVPVAYRQFRQDFEKFEADETTVLVVGPEVPKAFGKYWEKHDPPKCPLILKRKKDKNITHQ